MILFVMARLLQWKKVAIKSFDSLDCETPASTKAIMIIESVEVVAPAGKNEDLERGLGSLLGPVRAEAGCLASRLFRDATNPSSIRFEAHWKTKESLAQHVRSDEYRKLLFLVELSAELPTVEFHEVAQTFGLEFVQSARNSDEFDASVGGSDMDSKPLARQP